MISSHNMKFYFAQEYEEDLYFSSAEFNGLFKKNMHEIYVEYLGAFENEKLLQTGLHSKVFLDNNKLFFLPYNGTGISVYDLKTKQFEFIRISSEVNYAAYVNAINVDNLWLLIPQKNDWDFLWLDTKRMCVIEDKALSDLVLKNAGNFQIDLFASFLVNEKLYISFYGTPYLGIIDIKKRSIVLKSFNDNRLINIEKSGEDIWISTLEGNVIRWNEITKKEEVFVFPTTIEHPFFYLLSWENRLFLIPFLRDEIYEYDYKNSNWHSLASSMPLDYSREIYEKTPLIVGYAKKKDNVELYPRSGNGILVIRNNDIKFMPIRGKEIDDIVEEYTEVLISKQLKADGIVMESNQTKLESYLKTINY